MGSLMAGWDSPDSPKRALRRKSSMTNDEVEKFWKAKRHSAEHDAPLEDITQTQVTVARPAQLSKSVTIPSSTVVKTQSDVVSSPHSGDWWTRSSWAFLNDPPSEIRPGDGGRYVPQFDVATRASLSREMSSGYNCSSSPILGPS